VQVRVQAGHVAGQETTRSVAIELAAQRRRAGLGDVALHVLEDHVLGLGEGDRGLADRGGQAGPLGICRTTSAMPSSRASSVWMTTSTPSIGNFRSGIGHDRGHFDEGSRPRSRPVISQVDPDQKITHSRKAYVRPDRLRAASVL
jgi:hypothetical protein